MEIRLTSSGKSSHSPQNSNRSARKARHTWRKSVIEWSSCQCSMTLIWKGKTKSMPRHLTMDTRHSWDLEKKASGVKDMQPIMVASGIFMFHKWWETSRIPDIRHSKVISLLDRGILKKKNNRDTNHFNGEHCNIDLLYRTVHSANQLCIYGAVTKWCGTNSGEASQSRLESTRKTCPEIQVKQEDFKSLVDIPRLPHASGNRMLQNLKDFSSMPFMSKIEYLRTTAKFYHPIKKGNYYATTTLDDDGWGKTHVNVQRIYSAQKPRGFKAIRINRCKKRNWSSF